MMPCIEEIQDSLESNCYRLYQILCHHNLNCSEKVQWKVIIQLLQQTYSLLTLDVIAFMCSSKVTDVPNLRPKFFLMKLV